MANVLGVKTNIGIRLIIALIIIIYGPGNWVKYSGKVLERFWKIIGKNVWEPCSSVCLIFQRGTAEEPQPQELNDEEMLAAVIAMSRQEAGLPAEAPLEDQPTKSPDTGFGDAESQELDYHCGLGETDSKQPTGTLDYFISLLRGNLTIHTSQCFYYPLLRMEWVLMGL